ncbi:MAG: hypothetical protein H0U67_12710 [Gemmatimonadetes bacterium]|nr:hypothetical protein [Gemmatimonadota bacterium]
MDAPFGGVTTCRQIGDSTTVNRMGATPVAGGHRFSQISVGGSTACALTREGQAMCWGSTGSSRPGASQIDPCSFQRR